MKERSGRHAISRQSLSLVLLFLLLPLRGSIGDGVLNLEEDIGQTMDGIPAEHQDRLDLLTTVLAMDKKWSAIWSEKLKPILIEDEGINEKFCPSLLMNEGNIDTIDLVKKIMINCSHSGMYVRFAVKMLAISAQCLLNRHAKLQLDIIKDIPQDAIKDYNTHLRNLVEDYKLIANVLASVDADLIPLIALAKFFTEVRRNWFIKMDNKKNLTEFNIIMVRKAGKLSDFLDKKSKYCAESPTHWYEEDKKNTVIHEMDTTKPMSNVAETDSSTILEEGSKDPKVRKAEKLRLILRNEFEKLLLGKLPPDVWELIFQNNILVTPPVQLKN